MTASRVVVSPSLYVLESGPGAPTRRRRARFVAVGAALAVATLASPSATAQGRPTPAATRAPDDPLRGLDKLIEQQMAEWGVPGMALVVVRGDQTLKRQAYGLRDLKRRLPMTTRTLFPLGSISKSFTSLLLMILAEQGKLDWDAPLRRYLPDLRLKDAYASEHASARDLITNRWGLPGNRRFLTNSTLTREQLVGRLAYLDPSHPLRDGYVYSNLSVTVAGHVAERITGRTWAQLVRSEILDPLGMKQTGFFHRVWMPGIERDHPDVAHHYTVDNGQVVEVHPPDQNQELMAPAFSVMSNAEDLERYLRFHLDRGGAGSTRLVSTRALNELHRWQQAMWPYVGDKFPERGPVGYALGSLAYAYRGHELLSFGGDWVGLSGNITVVPNNGIGIVVLTNARSKPSADEDHFYEIVVYQILDRLLGLPSIAWSDRYRERQRTAVEGDKARRTEPPRHLADTKPSQALDAYVGAYTHPGYGELVVARSSGGSGLRVVYNQNAIELEHFQHDVFSLADGGRVRFEVDDDGDIVAVHFPMDPDLGNVRFGRRAPPAPSAAVLDRLAGDYRFGADRMRVARQGGSLVLYRSLRPPRSLALRGGSATTPRFEVGREPSCTITFRGASAVRRVTEAVYACGSSAAQVWEGSPSP